MTPPPPASFDAMGKNPVAYIRRSKVEADSPGNISRDTQLAAIRARAGIDGHDGEGMLVLEDWGKSGRGKARRSRTDYGKLLDLVAADRVSTIYAYNWSRLGRSTRDLLELADLCTAHGTAIVTATGQSVDPTVADGRMLLTILTAVDEWQAEVMAERATAQLAQWRKANPGKMLGRKPYGDDPADNLPALLAAWDQTGGFLATAKALNAAGIPARLGGAWDARTVGRVIRRHRSDAPAEASRGTYRARGTRIFSGLLQCDCGATLTSMTTAFGDGVQYYCKKAHQNAQHPRPYQIAQRKVREWAAAELTEYSKVVMTGRPAPDPEKIEAERQDLERKRVLILDDYYAGTIDKPERDRRLADVQQALTAVQERGSTVVAALFGGSDGGKMYHAPVVDFAGDPTVANTELRKLWRVIRMRHDRKTGAFEPVVVEWLPGVQEWLQGAES